MNPRNYLEQDRQAWKKRWKPKYIKEYYYIASNCKVIGDFNDKAILDKSRIKCGNCFKNISVARKAARAIKHTLFLLQIGDTK